MSNIKNRTICGSLSLGLITAAAFIATPAFAGDCSMKKAKNTAQMTHTNVQYEAVKQHAATTGTWVKNVSYNSRKYETIVDKAIATEQLSTLVAAVQAADLVETLSSPGPFTVFAPVNDAFNALPAGTVEKLLMPKNKANLTKILTAHVVAGNLSAKDITKLAKQNGGMVNVQTVSGDTLTAIYDGNTLTVKDENGGVARVLIADLMQSNGVVHIVSSVLVPS